MHFILANLAILWHFDVPKCHERAKAAFISPFPTCPHLAAQRGRAGGGSPWDSMYFCINRILRRINSEADRSWSMAKWRVFSHNGVGIRTSTMCWTFDLFDLAMYPFYLNILAINSPKPPSTKKNTPTHRVTFAWWQWWRPFQDGRLLTAAPSGPLSETKMNNMFEQMPQSATQDHDFDEEEDEDPRPRDRWGRFLPSDLIVENAEIDDGDLDEFEDDFEYEDDD
jgi:hypothetical protein